MSKFNIIEAENNQQQKLFIAFPSWLYKSNVFYSNLATEIDDFAPRNTVNDGIVSKTLLALSDDPLMPNYKTVVGRIAVFVRAKTKEARFTHFDIIDNHGAAEKLLEAAQDFARSLGAKHLRGPLSFNTNTYQGLMVNGFDKQTAPPYNYAYYKNHLEELGFGKDEIASTDSRRVYFKRLV